MIADNDVPSIMGYISFIRSNNVTILLDKSFKIEYIQKIISKYKPNYLFGPPEYFGKLIKIRCRTYRAISGKTNFPLPCFVKALNKPLKHFENQHQNIYIFFFFLKTLKRKLKSKKIKLKTPFADMDKKKQTP